MSTDKLRLVLAALEAEVVEEALDLYLQMRPVPADRRFDYRYRAAQSVLASLRRANREAETFPCGDDEVASPSDEARWGRRPLRERSED